MTKFAIAGLAFTLLATGASAFEVAWVHSTTAAQSEQGVKAGFEAWKAENAADWTVTYLDSGGSADTIASNIQDSVARGVDAIIVTMADLRASTAALVAAKEAGVPIFAVDSGYVDGVVVDVTTNNWAMSADVSTYLLDQLGGQGKIIFLRMAEHHGTRKRGDTMATILKEYQGVEVLAEHNIDITAFFEDTTTTMQDFVARYGNEIDAVWAPWDEPAQAALNVLKEAGLTDVKITGIDGHPQSIEAICSGDGMMIATVKQPFAEMGAQTGEWITEIVVNGKSADEVIGAHTVYLPAPLVTKQNCKDFM